MKVKLGWVSAGACAWMAAGVACLLPVNVGALDISDFINTESNQTHVVKGVGNYNGERFLVRGSVTIGETGLMIALTGPQFELENSLQFTITDTHVLVTDRQCRLQLGDICYKLYMHPTVYNPFLPREFQLGETYTYDVEHRGGFSKVINQVGELCCTILDDGWYADTVELTLFANENLPLTLYLARDFGFMELRLIGEVEGRKLMIKASHWDRYRPVVAEPVVAMWSETCNEGDGWRSCDWIGTFIPESIDSPWICHKGFGWAFCEGSPDDLNVYIEGAGWLWTRTGLYPNFYSYNQGGFIYYLDEDGSNQVWNYDLGEWGPLVH